MGLLRYIIRRLLMLVLMLFAFTLVVFAITMFFSPLNRASLYITNPHELDRETVESIIKKYGFDQPAPIQYLNWLSHILQGNLGYSYSAHTNVTTTILKKLPRTAEIILPAIFIIVIAGTYLGTKLARKQDKPIDHASRTMALISWGLPTFWLTILLIAIFYSWLNWFPMATGGYPLGTYSVMYVTSKAWKTYTGFFTIDGILNRQVWITLDALRHLVLPVAVLTISNIAIIMVVARSKMLGIIKKRYVAVTTAKELTLNEVTNKRMRISALFPATTLLGFLFGSMLISSILAETLFGIDGLGRWVAEAAGIGGSAPDVAALIGFILITGLVFVIASFIVDMVYAYVDPRIRQRDHSHIEMN